MLMDSSNSKKSSKNKKKRKSTQTEGGEAKKKAKAYLGSLKKKASDAPSTSSMFVIEVNIVYNHNQWVMDTSFGSHMCSNVHGLRNSR